MSCRYCDDCDVDKLDEITGDPNSTRYLCSCPRCGTLWQGDGCMPGPLVDLDPATARELFPGVALDAPLAVARQWHATRARTYGLSAVTSLAVAWTLGWATKGADGFVPMPWATIAGVFAVGFGAFFLLSWREARRSKAK